MQNTLSPEMEAFYNIRKIVIDYQEGKHGTAMAMQLIEEIMNNHIPQEA